MTTHIHVVKYRRGINGGVLGLLLEQEEERLASCLAPLQVQKGGSFANVVIHQIRAMWSGLKQLHQEVQTNDDRLWVRINELTERLERVEAQGRQHEATEVRSLILELEINQLRLQSELGMLVSCAPPARVIRLRDDFAGEWGKLAGYEVELRGFTAAVQQVANDFEANVLDYVTQKQNIADTTILLGRLLTTVPRISYNKIMDWIDNLDVFMELIEPVPHDIILGPGDAAEYHALDAFMQRWVAIA